MTRDGSLRSNEVVDLQPLLDIIDADIDKITSQHSKKRKSPFLFVVLCAGGAMLLIVHILSVVSLRKATITLEKLTLPDVCHRRSEGEIIVKLQNPSYCSPVVGPLTVTLTKEKTAFLRVRAPAFELQSGLTTMVSQVEFELLIDPSMLYNLVLTNDDNIDVHEEIPVSISCMLIPFTIRLDALNLLGKTPSQLSGALNFLNWQYALDPLLYGSYAWKSGVVDRIKTELQRVITQVLKTILLSHFHTYTDAQGIFAFTEVTFEYASRVLWNIPSLSVKLQSVDRQTILVAGLKQFFLGSGETFISAYTEVFKNQSDPLRSMLQAYLAGNDLVLYARGGNGDTDCYSLQVLDQIDIQVNVPAMIDGKPALLRDYSIKPSLKELDSKTHKCLLELELLITINNPLPIQFDLYGIELDLLFEKETIQNHSSLKFLAHLNNTDHVSWSSHVESSVGMKISVHNFDICMEVLELNLHDRLAFDIQHGHIYMGAGGGNFSIPFSAKGVHIHSSQSGTHELVKNVQR